VVSANLRALRSREPGSAALAKYGELAALVGAGRGGGELPELLSRFCAELGTRRLGELGLKRSDFAAVAAQGRAASSMKANPIVLSEGELVAILEEAW
jgi:alcohol dehydrogenase class IV